MNATLLDTPTAPARPRTGIYEPRRFAYSGVERLSDWSFKWYDIHHNVSVRPDRLVAPGVKASAVEAVRSFLPAMEREGDHYNIGYVILHQGAIANWLLVNWWVTGIISSKLTAVSKQAAPEAFEPYTGLGMACVFELEVICSETRAWTRNILMDKANFAGYLGDTMEAGLY